MIARMCNMELPHAGSQVLNRGVIARILSNFYFLLASLAERGLLEPSRQREPSASRDGLVLRSKL